MKASRTLTHALLADSPRGERGERGGRRVEQSVLLRTPVLRDVLEAIGLASPQTQTQTCEGGGVEGTCSLHGQETGCWRREAGLRLLPSSLELLA